ncbi:hypothetical protein [Campylobacter suis]|uniref:Uncharacterized protein n=1 Tax=Campylobacter suis TaxID=2790657 RepID=A0ABN7KAE6_9BACT|nr:hypothetical protein [Campylobacter suis]CAD7289464.1 hypothetical protein LMG8286_01820 [Campylobacter suis]
MKKLVYTTLIATLAFGFEFDMDSKNGAFENVKTLMPSSNITLKLENSNPITGADYDESKKQFALVSLENEFYVADESLNPLRYAKHDKHFMLELEKTVGATWYKGAVGMISYNKSFVFYEPVDGLSKEEQNDQWRHMLAGWDKFKMIDDGKGRFSTLRAKQQFILGWDYDEKSNKFVTASVPNDVRPGWSMAVFDGDDKMILEEYVPGVSESLKLKDDRDISSYYITGMDLQGDDLYLLSKNYSSILKLNLKTRQIEDVVGFDNVANPRALAIKDGKFYIFAREGQENKVYIFDMK